jgi:hypothetical protein
MNQVSCVARAHAEFRARQTLLCENYNNFLIKNNVLILRIRRRNSNFDYQAYHQKKHLSFAGDRVFSNDKTIPTPLPSTVITSPTSLFGSFDAIVESSPASAFIANPRAHRQKNGVLLLQISVDSIVRNFSCVIVNPVF